MKTTSVLLTALCMFSVMGGCGVARHQIAAGTKPTAESQFEKTLSEMSGLIKVSVLNESKSTIRVGFIDIYRRGGQPTTLEDSLTELVRASLDSDGQDRGRKIKLMNRELIRQNMAAFNLRTNEPDVILNVPTWHKIGVEKLLIGCWSDLVDSIEITLEVFDINNNGARILATKRYVAKDDRIRKLMGEKFPGILAVRSNDHDATLQFDAISYGEIGKGGKVIEAAYGSHSIRVEKKGFLPFYKSIWVEEKSENLIKVKFVSPSGAPVAAFFANAFLPGAATLIYGHKIGLEKTSVDFNVGSCVLFYTATAMYFTDATQSKGYLTRESFNRYNTIKHIELYAAIGSYGLNLISGYFVGRDYQKMNKRGVEVASTSLLENVRCHFAYSINRDKLLVVSYAF